MTDLELPGLTADIVVPPGRGRWRLTLHDRRWGPAVTPAITEIAELFDARSRRLELGLNRPAVLTFTLGGRSQSALALHELTTEVLAWRWNGLTGSDELMFAGPVTAAQDVVSENGAHAVSVTCQDYSALLKRRYATIPLTYSQTDQDLIVNDLVTARSVNVTAANGTPLTGSYLPVVARAVDPGGVPRQLSGQLRDRNYDRGQEIFTALENLGNVINGYDWAVSPGGIDAARDAFDVFFPFKGVDRPDRPLVYGWNVSRIDSRYVASADYANYQLLTGKAETDAEGNEQPPPFSELWTADALVALPGNPGLWMNASAAADVSLQSTLDEQVAGLLANTSLIVPAYAVTLKPGTFEELRQAGIVIGDTLELIVHSGRLHVETRQRLVSVEVAITDNATEEVNIGLGIASVTLSDLFTGAFRRLSTLEHR